MVTYTERSAEVLIRLRTSEGDLSVWLIFCDGTRNGELNLGRLAAPPSWLGADDLLMMWLYHPIIGTAVEELQLIEGEEWYWEWR